MKLAIMQPYFFPYLGYFSLIRHTDQWVVFDAVQFIRHGWIERNRVLKPGEGWQYIAVPLKKYSRDTLIKDIRIRVEEDWEEKIFRQLIHYKKAPYFADAIEVIHSALDIETDSIVHLDTNILATICAYLGIPFNAVIFSEMNLVIEPVNHAGQWALNISKAMGASEYINPYGGIEIFRKDEFDTAGICLNFMKPGLRPYSQRRNGFEQGLSIIDVMMFNSVSDIGEIINEYDYV